MSYKARPGKKRKHDRRRTTNEHGVTWAGIRRAMGEIARERGVAEGCPILVSERAVRTAKGSPWTNLDGQILDPKAAAQRERDRREGERIKVANAWRDARGGWVYLWDEPGKGRLGFRVRDDPFEAVRRLVHTIGVSQVAHTMEAEEAALERLASLINPAQLRSYRKLGMFLETSERSGVCYIFRRLAPTVAFRPPRTFLAALCLHPLAYYEGLPLGGMVPTDDVIAHLCMMRGDERRFWARSEQHLHGDPAAQI